MLIKTIPVGPIETNCYVVTNEDTLECVVIDPGDESNTILDYIEGHKLKCKAIMLTHGHYDHVGAVEQLSDETGATVYMNKRDDAESSRGLHFTYHLPDEGIYYDEGDIIEAAGMRFEIMATPGHTPGGVVIKTDGALFTGDTLFRGSCGRTDLPGGSQEEIMNSLKRICEIDGDYEVYPGHMESTSLLREKNFNFYCRAAMRQ